jgi:hypothetical protein
LTHDIFDLHSLTETRKQREAGDQRVIGDLIHDFFLRPEHLKLTVKTTVGRRLKTKYLVLHSVQLKISHPG